MWDSQRDSVTLNLWAILHFGARAGTSRGGRCADLEFSVRRWQQALGEEVTGALTAQQAQRFARIVDGTDASVSTVSAPLSATRTQSDRDPKPVGVQAELPVSIFGLVVGRPINTSPHASQKPVVPVCYGRVHGGRVGLELAVEMRDRPVCIAPPSRDTYFRPIRLVVRFAEDAVGGGQPVPTESLSGRGVFANGVQMLDCIQTPCDPPTSQPLTTGWARVLYAETHRPAGMSGNQLFIVLRGGRLVGAAWAGLRNEVMPMFQGMYGSSSDRSTRTEVRAGGTTVAGQGWGITDDGKPVDLTVLRGARPQRIDYESHRWRLPPDVLIEVGCEAALEGVPVAAESSQCFVHVMTESARSVVRAGLADQSSPAPTRLR
jgi:hypothetical protein